MVFIGLVFSFQTDPLSDLHICILRATDSTIRTSNGFARDIEQRNRTESTGVAISLQQLVVTLPFTVYSLL